jgi:hypothetical protein
MKVFTKALLLILISLIVPSMLALSGIYFILKNQENQSAEIRLQKDTAQLMKMLDDQFSLKTDKFEHFINTILKEGILNKFNPSALESKSVYDFYGIFQDFNNLTYASITDKKVVFSYVFDGDKIYNTQTPKKVDIRKYKQQTPAVPPDLIDQVAGLSYVLQRKSAGITVTDYWHFDSNKNLLLRIGIKTSTEGKKGVLLVDLNVSKLFSEVTGNFQKRGEAYEIAFYYGENAIYTSDRFVEDSKKYSVAKTSFKWKNYPIETNIVVTREYIQQLHSIFLITAGIILVILIIGSFGAAFIVTRKIASPLFREIKGPDFEKLLLKTVQIKNMLGLGTIRGRLIAVFIIILFIPISIIGYQVFEKAIHSHNTFAILEDQLFGTGMVDKVVSSIGVKLDQLAIESYVFAEQATIEKENRLAINSEAECIELGKKINKIAKSKDYFIYRLAFTDIDGEKVIYEEKTDFLKPNFDIASTKFFTTTDSSFEKTLKSRNINISGSKVRYDAHNRKLSYRYGIPIEYRPKKDRPRKQLGAMLIDADLRRLFLKVFDDTAPHSGANILVMDANDVIVQDGTEIEPYPKDVIIEKIAQSEKHKLVKFYSPYYFGDEKDRIAIMSELKPMGIFVGISVPAREIYTKTAEIINISVIIFIFALIGLIAIIVLTHNVTISLDKLSISVKNLEEIYVSQSSDESTSVEAKRKIFGSHLHSIFSQLRDVLSGILNPIRTKNFAIYLEKIENIFDNTIANISTKERHEQELESARNIQRTLIPIDNPQIPGYDMSGFCQPVYDIGGDFYDYVPVDTNKLALCIGDVTAKGISAATLVTMAKSAFYSQLKNNPDVSQTLSIMNEMVKNLSQKNVLMTFAYLLLETDKRKLHYSNAGHPPPYIYNAKTDSTRSLELETPHYPLGAKENQKYEVHTVDMESGDILLLYTNGIVETRNNWGEVFGYEKLERILKLVAHNSSSEIRNSILNEISYFSGKSVQEDDMTLVVVKVV